MKTLNLLGTPGSCAPLALKYLSQQDDVTVIEACIKQGMNDPEFIEAAKLLGITLIPMDGMKSMEVRKFIREYPIGTFMVTTYDHVFIIENGIQIDAYRDEKKINGTRRILHSAWKVIK
jgi:hypothetical protein